MTNPTEKDEFDQAFEDTAAQLDEITQATLEEEYVQAALADPDHDESW